MLTETPRVERVSLEISAVGFLIAILAGYLRDFESSNLLLTSLAWMVLLLGLGMIFWGSLRNRIFPARTRRGWQKTEVVGASVIGSILLIMLGYELSTIIPLLVRTNWLVFQSINAILYTPVTFLGWIIVQVFLRIIDAGSSKSSK